MRYNRGVLLLRTSMPDLTDLELARAAAQDNPVAWNALIGRFGDLILATSMGWCEGGCRIPRGDYDCILRTIRAQRPEPADAPAGCREGLALYRYACTELKPRLAAYAGTESLDAFLLAALAEIRQAYLSDGLGRLTLPPALAQTSALAR